MLCVDNLNTKIKELYEEYKNDEYIINKLIHHINHELPAQLHNIKTLQISRESRKQRLTEGQNKFVNEFINKNTYFYCSTTEIFFKYDGNHYNIIKEDNIIHAILSTLSYHDNEHQIQYYEQQLLPWKFKIKTSSIKHIK